MTYGYDPNAAEIAVLGLIRQRESGNRYDALAGGGRATDLTRFPVWRGVVIDDELTHSAGAYMFEPGTYAWVSAQTKVKDFHPFSQDINALWLLRQVGPNSTESWAASGPYPTDGLTVA